MTEKEAIKLLALIKLFYPTAYKDVDDETLAATVAVWHETFADIPYPIMEMAIDHFRKVSKFAPTFADMYDELQNVYYMATEEMMLACMDRDEGRKKRCQYIMQHTHHLRGDTVNHRLNIGKISSNLLPEGGYGDGTV